MFKSSLLFPHKFKKIGWYLLIPSLLAGILITITNYEPKYLAGKMISIFPTFLGDSYFSVIDVNFINTIVGISFIIGGLLVGFSKEKIEDEFISKLRLSSLLWAVFVNYILLVIAFIFIYESAFFNVMVYNMFTVLIIFIIRFNYMLLKNSKALSNAE